MVTYISAQRQGKYITIPVIRTAKGSKNAYDKEKTEKGSFMYLLFGFLLFFCIVFFLLNHHRKKQILQKLCCMNDCEKIRILNSLAQPFGFSYLQQEDIITSTVNAWQRQFGYCGLFDKSAPRFHMIFDCEPIYFYWQGQTWLIELWKGQYGINTGAEIGIYKTEGLIPAEELSQTLFHSISDNELLPLSMELFCGEEKLFSVHGIHWWLTGFCMGRYSRRSDLGMKCAITFPDCCMMQSFAESLLHAGYKKKQLQFCNLTVSFCFTAPKTRQPRIGCFPVWWAGCQNLLFCRLYRRITRPCSSTLDRILYLYYYLPAAFRHMLRLKRIPRL